VGFFKRYRKREKAQFYAIRFDGTPEQAAEIVTLDPALIRKFQAGGLVIEVYYPDQEPRTLTRGDWLVKTRIGGWMVLRDDVFFELFEETA
jgi:hypothetical protein